MNSQTDTDLNVLLQVLDTFSPPAPIRFLEIGVFGGETARFVNDYCNQRGLVLDYWGIDNGSHPSFANGMKLEVPFPGANIVHGDSAEVFINFAENRDVVLVDGCHCVNHVILDTIHYGARVRKGGFLLFHDTAPHIQQTMRDPHGPDSEWFYNSVLAAHKLMGFPTTGWRLAFEDYDPNAKIGGMQAYQKI